MSAKLPCGATGVLYDTEFVPAGYLGDKLVPPFPHKD